MSLFRSLKAPHSFSRFTPAVLLVAVAVAISFVGRLLLLFQTHGGFEWTFGNVIGVFGIGFLYDLFTSFYFIVPVVLHLWLLGENGYQKPLRWVILGLFLIMLPVFLFTQLVPSDFNEDLHKAAIWYTLIRLAIFLLLSWRPASFRATWRKSVLYFDFFLFFFLLLFNAVSEWFFWEEFSGRYNFIAVDYLIYTTEVIGNIKESYPVEWIVAAVALLAMGMVYLSRKVLATAVTVQPTIIKKTGYALVLFLLPCVTYFTLTEKWRKFSTNEYANELAGNGIFQFGTAFWANDLSFEKYYETMPQEEAFKIVREALQNEYSTFTGTDIQSIERTINHTEPEQKRNVVLISVESLSASFMKAFGDTQNITPQLDSLAAHSLFFTNLYASGTRTVRGLEALSLALPPTPGQSIVKRPKNENLQTIGSVFRSKGYTTQYIYGGYSYFDNMGYYFGNNGYEVIDRTALKPEQISFSNIWGVADEDLFTLSLQKLDENYKSGKPFFSHIMTVSNHRPFTYPAGRIDIAPERQIRAGAVKYTDYSIGKFIREASSKPWFNNTVFVIVSDHCAGSAGSVQLPVTGYQIPMLIYAPGILAPRKVETLTAQIDIAPTILGLLNFDYISPFMGQDIFRLTPGKERAFITTYQGLGYLRNGKLVILSPVKQIAEFLPDFKTGDAQKTAITDSLKKQATAFYQVSSAVLARQVAGRE